MPATAHTVQLLNTRLQVLSVSMLEYLHHRYGPGQRFGKHVDDSVNLGGGICTEYTLLIYLTGSGGPPVSKPKGKSAVQGKDSSVLVGGETIFYGTFRMGSPTCCTLHVTCSSQYWRLSASRAQCAQCFVIEKHIVWLAAPCSAPEASPAKAALHVTLGSLAALKGAGCCTGPRGKVVARIVPKAGRALLHRHGDCCLEHEATPVTSGLKYILRTDVCFATG